MKCFPKRSGLSQIRIKGPVWFVKISLEVSPKQVALLSAFVANGGR